MFIYFICVNREYDNVGHDSDDEFTKPLTRDELQNRVMDSVKKKEAEASKDAYQFELAAQKQKQKNKS